MQIVVQTKRGSETVSGVAIGTFLIHRPLAGGFGWVVSHRRTGLKFPCIFETHKDAKEFAKKAAAIMDFDAIEVEYERDNGTAAWKAGAPTRKQRDKIKTLMQKLGC